jgi:hypothetical protein
MDSNFLLGVASSIVASALTYLATVAFRFRLPTLATLFFWRKLATNTHLIVSEVPLEYDPKLISQGPAPLTPIGDAVSLFRLADFFRIRLRTSPEVASATENSNFLPLRRGNLIIIGGPKYNVAAHHLLSELNGLLPYQFQRIVTPVPRQSDDPNMKRIVASQPELSDITIAADDEFDYGMLIIAKSPYVASRYVVLAAGLGTHGTLGATSYLLALSGFELLRALWSKNGIQYIVRCRALDPMRVSQISLLYKGGF